MLYAFRRRFGMSAADVYATPLWERDLLVRGMNREYEASGGGTNRPGRRTGVRRSLSTPPPDLARLPAKEVGR